MEKGREENRATHLFKPFDEKSLEAGRPVEDVELPWIVHVDNLAASLSTLCFCSSISLSNSFSLVSLPCCTVS